MDIGIPIIKSRPITLVYDIPISKTNKFWEGLKKDKIYATKCRKCKKIVFPPVADCSSCLSSDMDWVELSSEAKIEAFTHVVLRPTSFQHERPYTVVIGKTTDGVQILTWLTGIKISEVRVGKKVRLVVRTSSEEKPMYVFVSDP